MAHCCIGTAFDLRNGQGIVPLGLKNGPHCLLTWVCKYLSVTTYLLFLIPPPASMAILCSEYAEVFKYFKQAGGFALSGAMCGPALSLTVKSIRDAFRKFSVDNRPVRLSGMHYAP
eukprot:1138003-Pelagomonas_calceolata.AAC.2